MSNTGSSGFFGFVKAIFFGRQRPVAAEPVAPVEMPVTPVENVEADKPTAVESVRAKKPVARRNDWRHSAPHAATRAFFREGQVVTAVVRRVDEGTAYLSVNGTGSATVSAKACAKEGAIAYGDLAVGQKVRGRVKAWYPKTRQLVFAGIEGIVSAATAEKDPGSVGAGRQPKPNHAKLAYATLPAGTAVLVDGANVLHAFKPTEVSQVLRSLVGGLKAQGYEARIFLEHRVWKFLSCNQASEAAGEAFMALCRELDVTFVGREADLAILQSLRAVPNSVGVTNDRYADYAEAFPDLVGTDRLRGFSVTRIGGRTLISVDGLSEAVEVVKSAAPQRESVPEPAGEAPVEAVAEMSEAAVAAAVEPMRKRGYSADLKGGLDGLGAVLLAKGNVRGAIRCFKKAIARHLSEGYEGLAEVCARRGDAKEACRFAWLGERLQHRLREQDLRKRRLWAERRRTGVATYARCA